MSGFCIYYDPVFKLHEPPYGYHMEAPERLDQAVEGLVESGIWSLAEHRTPPRRRGLYVFREVHSPDYITAVLELAMRGGGYLDPDTYVSPGTPLAAEAYAAAVLDAAESLLRGECRVALVLGRPPGHHAGFFGRAMGAPTLGFCIFNVSALAALTLHRLGYQPLVVDIDLHHGNGTQDILYDKPVYHIDLHQDPSTIYPGSGWPWQTGEGEGRGTKLNLPLPPGTGDDAYLEALDALLALYLERATAPDIVVVDAGLDAYWDDELGSLRLTTAGYHALGRRLAGLGAPVLLVLEGGYSAGLRRGLPALLAGLAGWANPFPGKPTTTDRAARKQVKDYLGELVEKLAAG